MNNLNNVIMRKIRLSKTMTTSALQSERTNGRWVKRNSIFNCMPTVIYILALLFLVTQECKAVDGALKGVFSVSETKKVVFSKGNLQKVKEGETWTWKFAEHQYDYIGESQTEENKDMFGYEGWAGATSLIDAGWYVLSRAEWEYVCNTRTVSNSLSNIKCILASIGETYRGLILFPDNYIHPDNTGFSVSNPYEATVSLDGWAKMEEAGCVFIPAAGYNNGSWCDVGSAVAVSSSTELDNMSYYTPYFQTGNFNYSDSSYKGTLTSVRMVREASVTLTDAGDITELETYAGQTVKVNFTRSFTAGKASTVCLPFAYSPQTGEKFYTFTGITNEDNEYVATMTEYTGTALVANTPYLYKAETTGDVDFSGTYTIPADLTAGTTTSGDWTFVGTYETLEWTTAPTGIYGFSANDTNDGITQGQFVKVGEYVRIKPMRCYLKYKNGSGNYASPRGFGRASSTVDETLPETISVRLIGADGNVTSIGTLNTRTGEMTNGGWYTLDGKRLNGQPTRKGIYVNNGKKVIIK